MGLGDAFKKALYLGIGLADLAQEKATASLQQIRQTAQELAEELVRRGEMNAEEARKYVDNLVEEARRARAAERTGNIEPRPIDIVAEEASSGDRAETPEDVAALRHQIEALQAELQRLRSDRGAGGNDPA